MTTRMASSVLPTWLAVLGILTYHVVSVHGAGGPHCYSCDRVSRAQECATIIQCTANEKCFSQRSIGANQHEFYKLGCIDKDLCRQRSFSLIGRKRDTEDAHAHSSRQTQHEKGICLQCCDGEYCNRNLCGSLSTSNLRRCFQCDGVQHPNDCDNVVECGSDHFCFVHRGPDRLTFEYSYDMGCMPTRQCIAAAHAYQNTGCMICCNDRDYCNLNICDNYTAPTLITRTTTTTTTLRPSATPPTIVLVPGPTAHAQYGHNMFAKCITDPAVTVTWGFNGSALPKGVRTDHKGGLWIDHISGNTTGVYKCYAVAPSGMLASKQITVKITQVPAIALHINRQPIGIVHPGQSLSLTCRVVGYPVPTISWTFTDRNGVAAIPTSVAFSQDNRVLTINPYSAVHNDGDYSCYATNKFGVSITKTHVP